MNGGAKTPAARLEAALAGVPRKGTEGSFKMGHGTLIDSRGLIGIEKRHLPPDTLLRIADALGAPADYREKIAAEYERSNFFYFGYEDESGHGALKLYVEYPVDVSPLTPAEANGPEASRPSLAGLGYKWSPADGAPVGITQYVFYVRLAPDRILERMGALLGGVGTPAFEVARDAVVATAHRVPIPVYMEAVEPGNPRRSFDVNVYGARTTVASVVPRLTQLGAAYAVDRAALAALLDAVKDRKLGHFSGGMDRHRRDYLTTYYVL